MDKDKEQKELLAKCRYFDGMPTPPETLGQNEQMLWFYERKFVFETLNGTTFKGLIEQYKQAGLAKALPNDGVPIALKALLFDRYGTGCYSMQQAIDGFPSFYRQYYSK